MANPELADLLKHRQSKTQQQENYQQKHKRDDDYLLY